MPIQFECYLCGKKLVVADEKAGKRVKCACSEVLTVPGTRSKKEDDDDPPPRRSSSDSRRGKSPPAGKRSAKSSSGSPVIMIAAAAAGLLVAVGIGVAFFVLNSGSSEPAPVAAATPAAGPATAPAAGSAPAAPAGGAPAAAAVPAGAPAVASATTTPAPATPVAAPTPTPTAPAPATTLANAASSQQTNAPAKELGKEVALATSASSTTSGTTSAGGTPAASSTPAASTPQPANSAGGPQPTIPQVKVKDAIVVKAVNKTVVAFNTLATQDYFLAMQIAPKKLFNSPLAQVIPFDDTFGDMQSRLGDMKTSDPRMIEQVMVFLRPIAAPYYIVEYDDEKSSRGPMGGAPMPGVPLAGGPIAGGPLPAPAAPMPAPVVPMPAPAAGAPAPGAPVPAAPVAGAPAAPMPMPAPAAGAPAPAAPMPAAPAAGAPMPMPANGAAKTDGQQIEVGGRKGKLRLIKPPKGTVLPEQGFAFIIRYADPLDVNELSRALEKLPVDIATATIQDKTYFKIPLNRSMLNFDWASVGITGMKEEKTLDFSVGFCLIDPKTVVVAPEESLKKMLTSAGAYSPLSMQMGNLDKSSEISVVFSTRGQEAFAVSESGDKNQSSGSVDSFVQQITGGSLALSLTGKSLLQATLASKSAEGAQVLNKLLGELAMSMKQLHQIMKFGRGRTTDPEEKAIQSLTDKMVKGLKVTSKGDSVFIDIKNPGLSLLVGDLRPLFAKVRATALVSVRKNNLRQLALATRNYQETFGSLPPSHDNSKLRDSKGKPYQSWRVHLLSHLREQKLAAVAPLDKPLTTASKKTLDESLPRVFWSDLKGNKQGKTRFLAIQGPDTLFPQGTSVKMGDITDGAANTILYVEAPADKAIPWTSVDDLRLDERNPLNGLDSKDGLLVVMVDGTVKQLRPDISADNFKALVTPAKGEKVDDAACFVAPPTAVASN